MKKLFTHFVMSCHEILSVAAAWQITVRRRSLICLDLLVTFGAMPKVTKKKIIALTYSHYTNNKHSDSTHIIHSFVAAGNTNLKQ